MSALRRLRLAIADGVRGFGAWQAEIPDQGRVVLVGLVGLAAAFLAAGFVPLAIGVPAGVLVIVGLGIDFDDHRTGPVLIAVIALVIAAVVLGGHP